MYVCVFVSLYCEGVRLLTCGRFHSFSHSLKVLPKHVDVSHGISGCHGDLCTCLLHGMKVCLQYSTELRESLYRRQSAVCVCVCGHVHHESYICVKTI